MTPANASARRLAFTTRSWQSSQIVTMLRRELDWPVRRVTVGTALDNPNILEDLTVKPRIRANRMWMLRNSIGVIAAVACFGAEASLAQEANVKPTSLAVSTLDDPVVATVSLPRAAKFLDEMAVNWTRERKCGSCHSNYPYLFARPALADHPGPALAEVRAFFEQRVTHWNDDDPAAKPRWDAEVIATATALALNDEATGDTLHPLTRSALDRMWSLQKPDGGFVWLKCAWPPLEHDDYYGALVAALGAGHAPGKYSQTPAAQTGLGRLRAYLAKNHAPDLHHQTVLLWAATRLEGLMSADQKDSTIERLRTLQHSDGGWSLPSLGSWKRRDGTPNDRGAESDGYATGLIVYVCARPACPRLTRHSSAAPIGFVPTRRLGALVYPLAQQ